MEEHMKNACMGDDVAVDQHIDANDGMNAQVNAAYGSGGGGGSDEGDEYDRDWSGGPEKANLIINYLPHEVDDINLKSLFMEHGEIVVAKVVKDKVTRKSLGFGFVKFAREEDAAAAIEAKNGFSMGHKRLKVSIARPPSNEIRNCKLYVTNLPKEYTEGDVIELFSQFGEIIECRVLKERNAQGNKGVAFVQFNLKSQANNALSLNGYRPPTSDRHLIVKYAEDQHKKKDRRMMPGHMMGGSPMGMGGMSMNMMESSMMSGMGQKLDNRDPYYYQRSRMSQNVYGNQRATGGMEMQQMGNVMGVANQMSQMYMPASTLMYSTSRGKNMVGPGITQGTSMDWFAQMPQMVYDTQQYNGGQQMQITLDHMMAQAQAQQVQSHAQTGVQRGQQQGSNMSYGRSPRMSSNDGDIQGGSATLIISGLPHNADLALLNDLCAPYGRVLDAQIDTDRRGEDAKNDVWCGRGRVQMVGMAQAQYAMQALNGVVIFEGGKPLHVSIVYPSSGAGMGASGEHMNRGRR